MPSNTKVKRLTVAPSEDLRQVIVQLNNVIKDVAAMQMGQLSENFQGYFGVGANSGGAPLARGSTDTNVGTAAMAFSIAGVPTTKAAAAAGTAFGALGTIPASTWGIIAIDVIAAGTVTYVSGALNYTTGYATEALALAAVPLIPRTTLKARAGYVTILASASTFVVGTDALAGGSSGNPATTTNYYPAGSAQPTGTQVGPNGIVQLAPFNNAGAWTAGVNGVQTATILARGSTDTRASTTPFIYNANGLSNVPKAVDAAGTAFGALGTIPADQWGIIAFLIDGAGTKTYLSGPANYTTGYATEPQAIGNLGSMFPAAGLCFYGYITIKTKAATAFIVGTDALAGGASGNVASVTNYYPIPGVTPATGESACLIAGPNGVVVS